MGLLRKKGNEYFLHVDPKTNELAGHFLSLLEKGSLSPEVLFWSIRKGEYGLLKHQFEVLVLALIFSGNTVAFQGQRKRGLEDISRTGLQGITALGIGEILGEELRQVIPQHPLIPEKFRKGVFTLPSQEGLWNEVRSLKETETESLRNLFNRIGWASSFQAFKNLPWASYRQDAEDVLAQWDEVKVSFPARDGLERFLKAAPREPFLSGKLQRIEELKGFFDHAERVLFVHQYVNDPRLSIPDRPEYGELREQRSELLRFFAAGNISLDRERVQGLLRQFQDFRERYVHAYLEAHRREKSGEQFSPYEKVRASRRYQLLCRLDQLEMVSVRHNRGSVDRALAGALKSQCNADSPESLQGTPVCTCGFVLGKELALPPIQEIEEAVDLGIRETLHALNTPTYQEKILPYLSGLEAVGEVEKASPIRRILSLSPDREDFLNRLDEALTPLAIQGINDAFRGRVVIVNRDLDQLYGALVHRKYTLSQVRKIFREWLREEEVSEGTFVQFTGKGEAGEAPPGQDELLKRMEADFPHLLSLAQEGGHRIFKKALLLSLWAEEQEIPFREVVSLFPFLEKGGEERAHLLFQELSRAARSLRGKDPSFFDSMAQEVEREEGMLPVLWKLMGERESLEIFRRETIFPSLLRESFERLLALPGEKELSSFFFQEGRQLPSRTQGFNRKYAEMAAALKDYLNLHQKIQVLKRREASQPQDFQKWESLFIHHLSPLSYLLGTFPPKALRLSASLWPPVKEKLAQAEALCHSLSQSFAEYYRQASPRWEAGEGKRPVMIEDLPEMDQGKGKLPREGETIYVLLDGMRWDLWEYLKETFFSPMANQLRIVHEGALWAHMPSSTPEQMERLEKALEKERKKGRKELENLWKMVGVDERVHTEKGDLEYLFRNVLQYLQLDLAPRLRELPPRTALLFCSDHGFRENPNFDKSDKYRTPRYLHGEASPFEIIVPWAAATTI
jgi:hypothetical protein